MILIAYSALTLREACYVCKTVGGHFDADRQAVMLQEEDESDVRLYHASEASCDEADRTLTCKICGQVLKGASEQAAVNELGWKKRELSWICPHCVWEHKLQEA
ncbi:MAG TPA: hypothetical protein ENN68_02140 [Methanomicrobia archaeon]|nr:hypothetical protein [Methanomicrobia archaeon]